MNTHTFAHALRNAFATLIGYPPVIGPALSRRLGG